MLFLVNLISVFMISFLLLITNVAQTSAETRKECCEEGQNIEGRVIKSDPFSLALDTGHVFSLVHFLWDDNYQPWSDMLGLKLRIEPIEGDAVSSLTNRYGEIVGKLISTQVGWLQKYWISNGLAVWKGVGGYPEAIRKNLLEIEELARLDRRGIWKKLKIRQADKFDYYGKSGAFTIVEGRVIQVRRVGSVTYLNFSEDWKTDFTAAISSKNRVNFKKQSWKLLDLENKWVRIRGPVRFFNGPYMDVVFPDQIELLDRPTK